MLNQAELSSLKRGDKVDHYLLIRRSEIRLTKNNNEYLSLELGDKSQSVNANVWENFESYKTSFLPGAIVKVRGTIEDYQGTAQIKVSAIRPLNVNEKITAAEFLPKSKRNLAEMKKEFYSYIEKISNPHLNLLMQNIFYEDNFLKFSLAPAAKMWHHAYIHGLLEHTLEIIRICNLMCDIHHELNRDLLICGAIMHDFGKVEELSSDVSFDYTDKGKLIGHIVIAAMKIENEAAKIEGFPDELKNCLIHLVLSHQGKLEYASPVVPKTLEAIALYHADELSAKINAYKNALETEIKGEGKWTKYISLASTDLFKHTISKELEDQINKSLFD
jgi:3'-5' exoribonuclease